MPGETQNEQLAIIGELPVGETAIDAGDERQIVDLFRDYPYTPPEETCPDTIFLPIKSVVGILFNAQLCALGEPLIFEGPNGELKSVMGFLGSAGDSLQEHPMGLSANHIRQARISTDGAKGLSSLSRGWRMKARGLYWVVESDPSEDMGSWIMQVRRVKPLEYRPAGSRMFGGES